MATLLTQKDVDGLLRGEAPVAGGDIVPYDFARPPRVSKDRRVALESIYGSFALMLQTLLTSRLRTAVDVTPLALEQVTLNELVLSLPAPCAAFTFRLGDRLGGQGVLDLGNDVAFYLLDRLFGGSGDRAELSRGLSALEQGVMRPLVERSLALFRDAWQDHVPIAPQLDAFESDPELLQIAGRGDSVLSALVEVRSGTFRGVMTIAFPATTLDPFLRPGGPVGTRGREPRQAHQALLETGMKHARLGVAVRLPAVWLSAREVLGLKVGQTIETRHPVGGAIEVHVNGRHCFTGAVGQVHQRVGVRITDLVTTPVPASRDRGHQGRVS